MNKIFFLLLLLMALNAYAQAQKLKDNFNIIIRTEEGDLNHDGLKDKVVLSMDTVSTYHSKFN